jgi:hypothetical protein
MRRGTHDPTTLDLVIPVITVPQVAQVHVILLMQGLRLTIPHFPPTQHRDGQHPVSLS